MTIGKIRRPNPKRSPWKPREYFSGHRLQSNGCCDASRLVKLIAFYKQTTSKKTRYSKPLEQNCIKTRLENIGLDPPLKNHPPRGLRARGRRQALHRQTHREDPRVRLRAQDLGEDGPGKDRRPVGWRVAAAKGDPRDDDPKAARGGGGPSMGVVDTRTLGKPE